MVWWIASWAEDEQLQGKKSLLRRGALVLGEFVLLGMIRMIRPFSTVVASPIYRGTGPLPKY